MCAIPYWGSARKNIKKGSREVSLFYILIPTRGQKNGCFEINPISEQGDQTASAGRPRAEKIAP